MNWPARPSTSIVLGVLRNLVLMLHLTWRIPWSPGIVKLTARPLGSLVGCTVHIDSWINSISLNNILQHMASIWRLTLLKVHSLAFAETAWFAWFVYEKMNHDCRVHIASLGRLIDLLIDWSLDRLTDWLIEWYHGMYCFVSHLSTERYSKCLPLFWCLFYLLYIDTHSIWLFSLFVSVFLVCFSVGCMVGLSFQSNRPIHPKRTKASAKVDLTDGVAKECRFLAYNRNLVLQRILFCKYILGAGGSPKVLWLGYCECLKIVISLWWNVGFWRSHSLHRMVFCADDFFFDPRVDWWKTHHSYIYTCEKRVICVVKWRFWKCYDCPSVQKCCGPQYSWR